VTENNVPYCRGPEPSSSLLVRVKAREGAAWDRLVHLFAPLVLAWCRKAGLQAADAEDMGQRVFEAVHRGVGAFRRDRPGDSFRGWLRQITRNEIATWYRRKQNEPVAVGGSDALARAQQLPAPELADPDPESDRAEVSLLYDRVLKLIQSDFEEATWRAFLAVVRDGRRPKEVAADLGKTPNAVYQAIRHVRKRLREEFADLLDAE
jgi:RNA polymerase sigma-70 factor, ECF subfamily